MDHEVDLPELGTDPAEDRIKILVVRGVEGQSQGSSTPRALIAFLQRWAIFSPGRCVKRHSAPSLMRLSAIE